MKDKDKNTLPEEESDVKLDIQKSVFEVNKELRKQREEEQAQLERELEEKRLAKEKKRQEAYEKQLLEEKKELIKLKQGLIEESETIHEEEEAPAVMTPWQKFRNFIYHNKWWLGIGIIFALIVGFLIYNYVTKPRPDIVVLVIADNPEVGDYSDLEGYIQSFTEDFNGNGKVLASVYYIQLSDNDYRNYANGTDNKLTTQLQSADGVIVIGGKDLLDLFTDEETGELDDIFMDMGELFPGDPHIKDGRYYLKGTKFAEKIGTDEQYITDDLFIAVREPRDLLYSHEDDMQETLDKDLPVLEKIIADLSEE